MTAFTPLNSERTERLSIPADEVTVISGSLETRELGKKAVVSINGKTYEVFGVPCDLPGCNCDAVIQDAA